jgi:hypothetical protein
LLKGFTPVSRVGGDCHIRLERQHRGESVSDHGMIVRD